jgi:hypothetical protein
LKSRNARRECEMLVAKTVTVALAVSALLGLVGCVETRGSLTNSADRLEHNANALARDAVDVRARDYPAGFARDAHALADDAHEFRNTAEDRRASDADVKAAFERVSRSYHLVRDEVDRSDSREAQADLQPVTEAYLDVERGMGGYPERRASAEPLPYDRDR